MRQLSWHWRSDAFAALPAVAQTVQERLPTCLACHGESGQSQNPEVPSLGAQQAYFVTVQLLMFRDRMRVVDPMNEMAKGLADADLQSFALARQSSVCGGCAPPATPDAASRNRTPGALRR